MVGPHAAFNPQTAAPQFASANTARTWKTDPPKNVPNYVFTYDRFGNFIRDHVIPGTSLPPQTPDFVTKGVHQSPFRPDPSAYVVENGEPKPTPPPPRSGITREPLPPPVPSSEPENYTPRKPYWLPEPGNELVRTCNQAMVPEAENFIRDYEQRIAELEAVRERLSTMELGPQEEADLMARYEEQRIYTESQRNEYRRKQRIVAACNIPT
jgi:hypothetical protein